MALGEFDLKIYTSAEPAVVITNKIEKPIIVITVPFILSPLYALSFYSVLCVYVRIITQAKYLSRKIARHFNYPAILYYSDFLLSRRSFVTRIISVITAPA